jgi:putative membrane protein
MRTERTLLVALFGFTLAAVAGFGTFAVDPTRLTGLPPSAARFYAVAWALFAQAHVWLAMVVMAVMLTLRVGARWLPAFAVIYAVSLISELVGTGYGIPFGAYHYSSALGPAWLGRVPIVIPLSWFYMAVASYALTAAWGLERWWVRVGVASAALLAWDLALDPAMSFVTRYWSWATPGAYYGMPWSNLFGWFLTGVVLMGVY